MTDRSAPSAGSSRAGLLPWMAVLLVLGAALRLYRLGDWSLAGDEIYTLRDSLTTATLAGPKPLLFFLNYHVIRPFSELNEWGLRVLPALFGILAVPVMYWVGRTTIGPRTGLLAALLVAVSPWHVYWSQFARYYTLAFLLSAIYPVLLFRGLHTTSVRSIATGLAVAALAILAHPSAGVLLGGVCIWLAVSVVVSMPRRAQAPGQVWSIVAVGGAIVVASILLGPTLIRWADRAHTGYHRGVPLVLSFGDAISAGLIVLAMAGLLDLWRAGHRSLATFLGAVAGFPVIALVTLSHWMPVYTGYLFVAAPPLFLAAGAFLDRVAAKGSDGAGRRLVAGTCLLLVLAAGAPPLLSQYRDGGRPDFRGAARHLHARVRTGDGVVSREATLISHYLPGVPVAELVLEPTVLDDALQDTRERHGAALWLVAVIARRGGFGDRTLAGAAEWIWTRCRVSAVLAVSRLDYKYNELQVYRCSTARGP